MWVRGMGVQIQLKHAIKLIRHSTVLRTGFLLDIFVTPSLS